MCIYVYIYIYKYVYILLIYRVRPVFVQSGKLTLVKNIIIILLNISNTNFIINFYLLAEIFFSQFS